MVLLQFGQDVVEIVDIFDIDVLLVFDWYVGLFGFGLVVVVILFEECDCVVVDQLVEYVQQVIVYVGLCEVEDELVVFFGMGVVGIVQYLVGMCVVQVVVDIDYFWFDLQVEIYVECVDFVDQWFQFVWEFGLVDGLVVEFGFVVIVCVELVVVDYEVFDVDLCCFFCECFLVCFGYVECGCFLVVVEYWVQFCFGVVGDDFGYLELVEGV